MAEVKATKAVTKVTLSLTVEEAETLIDALDSAAVDLTVSATTAMYAAALSSEIGAAIDGGP